VFSYFDGMSYQHLLKPFLFRTDAEEAHELAISLASKTNNSPFLQKLASAFFDSSNDGLEQEFFGLKFPNPVGLAAGFDKNGTMPLAMQSLGFGFVEVGSITARTSAGNKKPRAFRLPQDNSIINRMGLNNEGADEIVSRLAKIKTDIPLGVNIAKTNDASIHGDAALEDYLYSYEKAQPVADYITVNISCPNTGEGKTFEDPSALNDLLEALNPQQNNRKPTLIKFSVDTPRPSLEKLVNICEDYQVSGYVATNTSSSRQNLTASAEMLERIGNGGLSGRAIQKRSTEVVRTLRDILGEGKPIIGVGGIDSAQAALEKLNAGANLLQIYTGLIFEGPGLVKSIKKGLPHH
ncbi:MAG: quinone-dependent dihydroorotate dehydrogenase, partial [Balneolaceae bacterium]